MTDLVAADARRTKNSIIIYLMLTGALSSIFYVLVIHHSSAGLRPGFLILGLMWCPGVSGLLTRLAFQGNLRGLGLGRGQAKYQFASYWIPLVYSSIVYVPFWLAGYYDSSNRSLAALMHRFPHLPHATALLVLFLFLATAGVLGSCLFALGEELGWHGFLVPQLAKITSYPARRVDQRRHLGTLALPPYTVCGLPRRRPAVVFRRVLHGDGAGNQLSVRVDAPEIRQRLDRRAPARQSHSLRAGLFRRADAPRPRYRPVDHRIRRRPRAHRACRRHYFLSQAGRTPGATPG
jgi:hypothetical protein